MYYMNKRNEETMEEEHINRLVQATKNSLEYMSKEQLKEIEKLIKKELEERKR